MGFALAPFIPAIAGIGASSAGTAAAIGAGSSILGGILDRRQADQLNASNQAVSREFAQHGIRWKVADAKAAGLHPLYAMQGSGATYSPTTAFAPSQVGRAGAQISQAILAKGQLRVMNAQANYYNAAAWRALLGSGQSQAAGPGRDLTVSEAEQLEKDPHTVKIRPDEVTSRSEANTSMTTGLHSTWQRSELWPGMYFIHPRTDQLGDMELWGWMLAAVGTAVWKIAGGLDGAYGWYLKKKPTVDETMQVLRELRRKYPARMSQIEGRIKERRDMNPKTNPYRGREIIKGVPQ